MNIFSNHSNFKITTLLVALGLNGCSLLDEHDVKDYPDAANVEVLRPTAETLEVPSSDDAADDPAIWVNHDNPDKSLIVGTDKRLGLGVYDLNGNKVSFLNYGKPNNVDIRQQVAITGIPQDYAAVSDRADNTIGLLGIDENGLSPLAKFPTQPEPYGFCMGTMMGNLYAFVTYKTGLIEQYKIIHDGGYRAELLSRYELPSQLEGCVMEDSSGALFVGEEAQGVWLFSYVDSGLKQPELVISVDDGNGLQPDIEGLALYQDKLILSSQGNDSYAVYFNAPPFTFVKRLRVGTNGTIDGAQETDGIEAIDANLGSKYPNGIFVVQDGFNRTPDNGLARQNFKIIRADFAKQ